MRIFHSKRMRLLVMVPATYVGFSLTPVIPAKKAASEGYGGVGLEVLLGFIILVASFDIPPGLLVVLRKWSDKISFGSNGKNKG